MKQRFGSLYNLVSLTGMILAIAAVSLMIVFLAMEEIVGSGNPYAGLVYFTFPAIFAMGLLLVLIGALRKHKSKKRWRRRRLRHTPPSISMIRTIASNPSFSGLPSWSFFSSFP